MEERKYHGKTLSDAITNACADLGITSDKLSYKVIQEEKKGFLGLSIGARECIIEVSEKKEAPKQSAPKKPAAENKPAEQPKKKNVQTEQQPAADNTEKKAEPREAKQPERKPANNGGRPQNRRNDVQKPRRQFEQKNAADDRASFGERKPVREVRYEKTGTVTGDPVKTAEEFLTNLFKSMEMNISYKGEFKSENNELVVDLSGDDMGVLIGKRGQTLDALQYLTSQVVNKHQTAYIRVKIDTENYRERRRETMETLAQNIAQKVKRTGKPVALEPMNPYERRIIHSILQNEKDIITRSEGVEPYRHVIVCPAKRRKNTQDRSKNRNAENEAKAPVQKEQAPAPKTDENAAVQQTEQTDEA